MSGQSYGNATIDWKAKAFDFTQVEVRLMALIMDEKSKAYRDLVDFIATCPKLITQPKLYPYQENIMSLFDKGEKLQKLCELVEEHPEGEPTMVYGPTIDRLKVADPHVNVAKIINDAMEKEADRLEAQVLEKARRQAAHELKLLRASAYVDNAKVHLQEAEVLLEVGKVTTVEEAKRVDKLLHDSWEAARAAARHVRGAFEIPLYKHYNNEGPY